MPVVQVMQPSVHEVVLVVTVWHHLGARAMLRRVGTTYRATARRVGICDLDPMLVDVVTVRIVQMAVVQVIDVVTVTDGTVATAASVLVIMLPMSVAGVHG